MEREREVCNALPYYTPKSAMIDLLSTSQRETSRASGTVTVVDLCGKKLAMFARKNGRLVI